MDVITTSALTEETLSGLLNEVPTPLFFFVIVLLLGIAYLLARPDRILHRLRSHGRGIPYRPGGYHIPLSRHWLVGVAVAFFLSPWIVLTSVSSVTLFIDGRVTEGLLFLVLTVLLIGFFTLQVSRLLSVVKFGRSRVTIARPFGVLGEEIAGEIVIPTTLPWNSTATVEFRCISHSRILSRTLWASSRLSRRVAVVGPMSCTSIPFRFSIPATGHETHWGFVRQVVWVVDATVRVRGIHFRAQFQVPVVAQARFQRMGITAAVR